MPSTDSCTRIRQEIEMQRRYGNTSEEKIKDALIKKGLIAAADDCVNRVDSCYLLEALRDGNGEWELEDRCRCEENLQSEYVMDRIEEGWKMVPAKMENTRIKPRKLT